MTSTDPTRDAFRRYAVASLAIVATVALRFALHPFLGLSVPFITIFPGVVFAAWYGGTRPGYLATLLGVAVALYLFIVPAGTFVPTNAQDATAALLFVVMGGFISFLIGRGEEARVRLAREQEKLAVTLASIGDATIVTDPYSRVTFLNPVAEELTGWTDADARGRPLDEVFRIVNESTRDPVPSPVEKALRTGHVVGLANHTVLIARGGRERPIEDSASPIRDAAGTIFGVVLVFRDATATRAVESERERLADVFQHAPGFMCVLSGPDHVYERVNERHAQLVGHRDLIGKTVREAVPEVDAQGIIDLLDRVYRTGEPFVGTGVPVKFQREPGRPLEERYLDFVYQPLRGPDGAVTGILAHGIDLTDRKLAEDALRASDERHRFLADLAAATQPLADPDAIMAAAARLLAEHMGVDRCAYAEVEDESMYVITGDHARGVPSIVGRWEVGAFGAEHHRMMRAGEPYVIDDADSDLRIAPTDLPAYRATCIRAVVCVPLLKGGTFTAAMAVHQAAPRRWTPDEVGLVALVAGRCWEALERARVGRTLQQAEERFRAAVAATSEILWTNDAAGRMPADQPGWAAFTGQTPDEYLGYGWASAVHPDDAKSSVDEWNRAVAERRTFVFEHRVRRRDGEYREFSIRAVPLLNADGSVREWVGTHTDVTDRKRAARELQASEERFRAFMDHSPAAAWITDQGGRIRYLSATYLRMFELPAGDLVGASVFDLYPADIAREYVANIRRVADSGRPVEVVEPGPRPDGTVGQFLVYKFPLPGEERLVGGVAIDITERLKAEDELREADRRKDEFLALLAHELRNPLAPIRNGLQVIRLSEEQTARERAQAMMDRQLGHMVRLVDDLLDVSRISRNKMELRRARLLLSDVVSSAVETVRPAIDSAGHELTVSLPHEPLHLDADLTRLAQVFGNLLGNSAKYTPPGGRISLSARQAAGEVVVTVTDTGIGIPAEDLPRIFDMFSQVDRSIERSTGGLGIGLALVRGLVEMHGGSVSAKSCGPNRGSEFTVRLPVARALSVRPGEDPASQNSAASGPVRRILVVDDNRDSAESMGEMLRLSGNEVALAHDGEDAIERAAAFRPEVILMDVGMPRMNGYEATRRIRQEAWGRDIAIVALTGWGQEGDRDRSREAGCDGHLVKPVSLTDLQSLLVG